MEYFAIYFKVSVLMALFLVCPARADLSGFNFDFANIPSSGSTCADLAQSIERAFKKGAQITLVSAECTRDDGKEYDIRLRYTAETNIDVVSTMLYTGSVPSNNQGMYRTLAECQSAFVDKLTLFKDKTGLEPAIAYCYRDSSDPSEPYSVRIDAFGKAKVPPAIDFSEFYGHPIEAIDVLEGRLSAYAKSQLENLAYIKIRGASGTFQVWTEYYHPDFPLVTLKEVGRYADSGSCEHSRHFIESNLGSNSPVFFCIQDEWLPGYAMEFYQVEHESHVERISYPKTYASFADCESSIPTVLHEVANMNPMGALCSGYEPRVGMQILIPKNKLLR